jgi:methylmalonyl-CoA epimerase
MYPLDHVGIAVENLDESITFYQRQLGAQLIHREIVASQATEVAFIALPNCLIELLTPNRPESPVAKFLAKHGSGLHHLCYRVPDVSAELARQRSLGAMLIDGTPRKGARGHLIAFVHPKSMNGVLTEFCQAT